MFTALFNSERYNFAFLFDLRFKRLFVALVFAVSGLLSNQPASVKADPGCSDLSVYPISVGAYRVETDSAILFVDTKTCLPVVIIQK